MMRTRLCRSPGPESLHRRRRVSIYHCAAHMTYPAAALERRHPTREGYPSDGHAVAVLDVMNGSKRQSGR